VEVLTSRELLRAVMRAPYTSGGRTAPLSTWLKVDIADSNWRTERTLQALQSATEVSVGPRTGIVSLTVHGPAPAISYEIVNRMLQELNTFNLRRRQTSAAAEMRFTQERLADARAQLDSAEDALLRFTEANRQAASPELRRQADRLEREVNLRQSLYVSMSQSYDQARIDETRDTPAITLIEHPELPLLPEPRGLARKLLATAVGALFVGLLLALVIDAARDSSARNESEAGEFARLRAQTAADLRRPWRLLWARRA
jgi:uncharacterized protein involved in exopolysaccharide biosynthesis